MDNITASYEEIVEELGDIELEVIYVDDGSSDGSLDIIRGIAEQDPRVGFISFTRNFGFEAAFSAGYRYAAQPWVLHIDADQQFPAAEARVLIDEAQQGYDAVFGVRTNRQDPLLRRWGTAVFHYLAQRVLRVEIPRGATAFRLVRTDLARRVVDLELGTPYFMATVPRLTGRYTTVAVGHRARERGESKVGFRFLASHAVELFVGFTRRLPGVAAGLALGTAALCGLLAVGAAAGVVGGAAVPAAVFVVLAVITAVLSVGIRYLVTVGSGGPRPRQFYIRETSLCDRVDPADLLLDERQAAPQPRRAEVAS
ncbi:MULTISPECIES: glycosyltransferase family 2 protein [Prauserella salsuginis group]|uniref:Glycosyltransferase family 2 protein n=1 Tax=Prauserella salsuginis TaxID=387889 RepID=A0ABW6GBQ6_9PSEU|nr:MULTISPECIES: glycosyltransferase family 2 protein [Prauserella salsuginis group]